MKKLSILVPLLIIFCSCNAISKKLLPLQSMGADGDSLSVDSIVFHQEKQHAQVNYHIDFPTDGSILLRNAVAEYIDEKLGGTYEGELLDGQQMVNFYAHKTWNELRDEYKEMMSEMDSEFMMSIDFYESFEIRKVYETDLVVTFMSFNDTYLGGAHGMQYAEGVTFRKSDGRRFGYAMMHNLFKNGFYQLTKEGLREYFSEDGHIDITDEDLKSYVMTEDDIDHLSRPRAEPYMTEKGIEFIYQPYEIAAYAAGMPTFVVSYDKIMPFLNVPARRMVKNP